MRDRDRKRMEAEEESESPPSESQGDGGDGRDPADTEPAPADVQDRARTPESGGPAQDEMTRLINDQRDKFLRLAAEYDNYRKRTAKERIEAESRGQADLVKR